MSREINAKKSEIGNKVTIQLILFLALLYVAGSAIVLHGYFRRQNSNFRDYLFTIIFPAFNAAWFLQLIYLPFGVTVDYEMRSLKIKYLLLRSKTVLLKDVTACQTTAIQTRSATCFGVILCLAGNKEILLSNLTLKNYTPVEALFEKLDVKYAGNKHFSFISYYRHQ